MKKNLEDMGDVDVTASIDFETGLLRVTINDRRILDVLVDPPKFLSEVFDIPQKKLE